MRPDYLETVWSQVPHDASAGYVYSLDGLRRAWERLRNAIPAEAGIYYSLKANPHPTIVERLSGWGASMDVCSLGELNAVLDSGVDPTDISYLGPGKTDEELAACVSRGVGTVVVESLRELDRLSRIAAESQREVDVVLRVNLSEVVVGSRLSMGGKPRQFGIDEEQLVVLEPSAIRFPAVRVIGFHSYSGTRNLSAKSIIETTRNTLASFERLAGRLGVMLRAVNVGGGFGVPYHDNESPLDLDVLRGGLKRVIAEFIDRNPSVKVFFESGRFIAAESGLYLTRVVDKKTSKGKTFLICSGGTNHFVAASGGGSPMRRNWPAWVLAPDGTARSEVAEKVDVSGPLCTPSDVLLKDAELARADVGDYVVIAMAGAYGASASPVNFLSHQPPYEVFPHEE